VNKKSRLISLMLACIMVLTLLPIFPADAEMPIIAIETQTGEEGLNDFVPGELLVKFKPSSTEEKMQNAHKSVGAQKIGEIKGLKVHQVKLPKGLKEKDAIIKYKKLADVEYAEPNYYRRTLVTPNDTYYGHQWALAKTKVPQAWNTTTGNEVIVAVIDTGVDYDHEDLAGKVIKGYDYINNDSDPMDDNWHGTHVAGIVAATTNNSKGIAGVSWGAKIMAVKVLNSSGNGTDLTVSNGITYAADNGAKIINLSLGGYSNSSTMENAIYYAQSKGCVIIAAAGNDNTSNILYPAGYQNVIGVSATDDTDAKASYSNYGWYVDVAAPGGYGDVENHPTRNVLSCYLDNDYAYSAGTSMAAPYVAGLASLIATRYPGRSASQLIRSMYQAVDDLGAAGRDNYFGHGRINAEKAVTTYIASAEENASGVSYSGSWSNGSSSHASGGAFKYSSSTGALVTYSFYGTSVSWIARKSTSSGIAKVYIDGVYQKDVDLYGNLDHQQVIYTKTGLSQENHTITIEVKGTRNGSSSGFEINVDAFDIVTLEDTTAPTTTITASPLAPDGNNDWYKTAPEITLTTDETATIYYKWDNGSYQMYSSPITAPAGNRTLTTYAVDLAGNAEVAHSSNFKVDTDVPAKPEPRVVALSNGDFKASWTSTDEHSGIDYYEVTINGETTTTSGQSHTFKPELGDLYTISVKAYDRAGRFSPEGTKFAKFNNTPFIATPLGINVAVAIKPLINIPPATIFFTNVASEGETSATASETHQAGAPSGYNLCSLYFDIETSATVSGVIRITVPFDGAGLTETQKQALKLLHYESGTWKEIPCTVDTDNNLITGETQSLSPFVVGQAQSSGGSGGGGGGSPEAQPPAAPANLIAIPDKGGVALSWMANKEFDLNGYNLYRAEAANIGEAIKIAAITKDKTGYTDMVVTPGSTYYYWISAYNTKGVESEKAGPVSITLDKRANPFKDIEESYWAFNYILNLTDKGIIGGYSDGTFRPINNVTRAEFAKMICLAMGWDLIEPQTPSFKDVPKSSWAYKYIETAKAKGVIGGYNDATFRPTNNITRAEIAKIVAETLKLPTGTSTLKDVGSHWAKDYIDACTKAGIVGGYSDNTFRPNNTATRAEAVKMVSGMIGE